jgi:hypothetical protein
MSEVTTAITTMIENISWVRMSSASPIVAMMMPSTPLALSPAPYASDDQWSWRDKKRAPRYAPTTLPNVATSMTTTVIISSLGSSIA